MDLLTAINNSYDLARDAGDETLAHALRGFAQLVKQARNERNMLSPDYCAPADRANTDTELLFDDVPLFYQHVEEFQGVSFEVKRV